MPKTIITNKAEINGGNQIFFKKKNKIKANKNVVHGNENKR